MPVDLRYRYGSGYFSLLAKMKILRYSTCIQVLPLILLWAGNT